MDAPLSPFRNCVDNSSSNGGKKVFIYKFTPKMGGLNWSAGIFSLAVDLSLAKQDWPTQFKASQLVVNVIINRE